ncbi:Hypothetical protein CINCED_3A010539 [Cinara cedri]|uniref:Uncharacterized protein n=1 Tax=Cinara cedri TaxID=506608 RepID=A0A5E4ML54_9HEMI|nr:Hypothetical protein CINCED_3A010539 [Cinara cedri]
MSYSTLKKALQLFEDPISCKNSNPQKPGNLLFKYIIPNLNFVVFSGKKLHSFLKKSKGKSQHAKNIFKVQNYSKTDAGKSVQKLKDQIKNEKDLNLVKINLDRLHKLDRTSCVNNIGSNLVCT